MIKVQLYTQGPCLRYNSCWLCLCSGRKLWPHPASWVLSTTVVPWNVIPREMSRPAGVAAALHICQIWLSCFAVISVSLSGTFHLVPARCGPALPSLCLGLASGVTSQLQLAQDCALRFQKSFPKYITIVQNLLERSLSGVAYWRNLLSQRGKHVAVAVLWRQSLLHTGRFIEVFAAMGRQAVPNSLLVFFPPNSI